MGTNYYLHKNACKHCGRGGEPIHIGKSSAGWCFSLHVIPEEGINTLEDWKALLADPENIIKDEYDVHVLHEEMLKVITERSCKPARKERKPFGYDSWGQFHNSNQSEDGPNGLLRHQINGHCIGHGEGTWDYIRGEFS